MIQDFLCNCNQNHHPSVLNGLSGAHLLSRDYLLLASFAILGMMRPARDLSMETHVFSSPFKMSYSWPAAGKAANCSMCSEP